jgi:hypothetical protein
MLAWKQCFCLLLVSGSLTYAAMEVLPDLPSEYTVANCIAYSVDGYRVVKQLSDASMACMRSAGTDIHAGIISLEDGSQIFSAYMQCAEEEKQWYNASHKWRESCNQCFARARNSGSDTDRTRTSLNEVNRAFDAVITIRRLIDDPVAFVGEALSPAVALQNGLLDSTDDYLVNNACYKYARNVAESGLDATQKDPVIRKVDSAILDKLTKYYGSLFSELNRANADFDSSVKEMRASDGPGVQ